LAKNGRRLLRRVEKIAGDVARVDRLDQELEPFTRSEIGGAAQIGDEHRLPFRLVVAGRPNARQNMEALAAGGARIAEGALEIGEKGRFPSRQSGKAAIALLAIAGGQVEERQREAMAAEPLGDGVGRRLIGIEAFDAAKAARRRRFEAVEERQLLKQEMEIGGELRHRRPR
jgi:hypothetical protein